MRVFEGKENIFFSASILKVIACLSCPSCLYWANSSFFPSPFVFSLQLFILPTNVLLSFLTWCRGFPTLCSELIEVVMRCIPTSVSPCPTPTSYTLALLFPGTLFHPPPPLPSQPPTPPPLGSPGPRVARSILFHRTSNRPDALHEGRTQGP